MATAVVLACVSCGISEEGASGGASATAIVATQPAQSGTAQAGARSADMVRAVGGGASSGPVELLFDLKSRPEVGEPVDIELALTPTTELTRVEATFRAGEGLELRSGAEMPVLERPEPGVPVSHVLTIVPRRDGIFSVMAIVHADSSDAARTVTFSIPIIAGAGITDAVAQQGAAAEGGRTNASN
ncbi:MAG: hypothetical protein DIU56_010700 [Pseudomonadota bacterium]|jgi:hypothetical protein|nr:MAG: hypothetical protein DIU56_09015 [Pseudomonadota bacterium]